MLFNVVEVFFGGAFWSAGPLANCRAAADFSAWGGAIAGLLALVMTITALLSSAVALDEFFHQLGPSIGQFFWRVGASRKAFGRSGA